ncbi:hypothetical protein CYMTET_54130 [Cymbomonas tetramitiformis]|uniref:Uncharacterized protein n=1 Tax=Cymbomonas tetramitiformis TaxID=36881 RepID=A0AAE0EPN5_9CHLO|nr:hypothetical protein CYMTET_54130 [Cymbomonas tetramitiformis]
MVLRILLSGKGLAVALLGFLTVFLCNGEVLSQGGEGGVAHVMLATPCYGGLVYDSFFLSVMRAMNYYRDKKVQIHAATVPGIADLPKARGALIYQFLAHKHYTHVLFVDADIEFTPQMIERCIASGKDVVTVMYPKKAIEWGNIQEAVRAGSRQVFDLEKLKGIGLNYPVEWEFEAAGDAEAGSVVTDKAGFARVSRAGAGFMMVKRSAIEAMVKGYPELAYTDLNSGQTHYAFFHTVLETNAHSTHWVSEDFAFCDRWRKLNGEVWVDLTVGLNHTGPIKFEGGKWIDRYLPQPPPREEL